MAEQIYSLGEETEQIEFKKSTGELKEAVISMAAILNKQWRACPSPTAMGRPTS
ncbi:MAG: hypothetical protein LUG99_19665 [Lachnospiraceae bacterium]|nr:hypothetical protein [Lachnospiraceae bacterium]